MTTLDLDFVRDQFPAFQHPETRRWGFFENAGGSYVPHQVNDLLAEYFTEYKVQPYGESYMQQRAGDAMDAGFDTIAQLINADRSELTIGPSTTMNLYVLAQAIRAGLNAGDEIIVTNQDHEANIGCWRRLEEFGCVLREWRVDPETGDTNLQDLETLMNERTRVVCFSLCSNIVGTVNDVSAICELANTAGAITVADGVSFAPHQLPDVKRLGVDFMTFSTYKTFGTHQGVLWGRKERLEQLSPQGHFFNAEKPNYRMNPTGPQHAQIGALAGIGAYVEALYRHHFGEAEADLRGKTEAVFELAGEHENRLANLLLTYLTDHSNQFRLIGRPRARTGERVGTVSVVPRNQSAAETVRRLAGEGIAAGAGNFYAVRCLEGLNIPPDPGVLRMSIVHYNTEEEVKRLIAALDKAVT